MKKTVVYSFILFLAVSFQAKASGMRTTPDPYTTPSSDSVGDVKNTTMIFKLISTPNAVSNSGSLKKAGKVARTSYSHTTPLENIIYKKKGI